MSSLDESSLDVQLDVGSGEWALDKESVESDLPQIRELRRRRGSEKVTFDQVADHLVDFAAANPRHRDVIDRVAGFLARVDQIEHSHDVDGGSTAV